MVGVPGRSKGCITCRRRKKKCDLQKPNCANCAKGRFDCEGFGRQMIVVQFGDDGKGQYRPRRLSKAPTPRDVVPDFGIQAQSLNRSALEVAYFSAFWNLYLPQAVLNGTIVPKRLNPVIRWVKWIQSMIGKDTTLRCALLALSLTNLGQARIDRAMIEQGMQLYGKALARLASDIRTPARIRTSEIMATTSILSTYEQLNDAAYAARNWHGHVNGLTSLISMHSPEECSEPDVHEAFVEARYNGVVAAIADRKATYLSSPDWIEKPWQGRRKNVIDTIIDVLVQFPESFEEFDNISATPLSLEMTHRAILLKERCWDLDRQLKSWYRDYITCVSGLLPREHVEYMLDGIAAAPQVDLPSILSNCGLAHLYSMSLYWGACILLYGMMQILYHKFQENPSIRTEILSSPRMDLRKYSLCIANTVKYFLNPRAGLAAALGITFSVSCISQSIPGANLVSPVACHDSEWKEIAALIEGIHSTAGCAWTNSFITHLNEWTKKCGLLCINAVPSGEWSLRRATVTVQI
ncbi:hypothetical protein P154DRAFT_619097 [Amniculicola lignicola CBS 123094]|uniref:Zn(2)-C6 fungal-type domain-containing protein n=1 Tax=Amniculicola lignicola CBS 123094 TaxID=1392246 RepID=A0A6A5WJV6_9PLEO|nr:hypothetical protein P154DRAFT_619097 [Amniculicola lignicola CBS 123094]